MKKLILLFTISFLMVSCENQSPKKESSTTTNSNQPTSTVDDQSNTGRTNFAVIWKWTTTNSELVSNNMPIISKELSDLWKDDVIENAYFDSEAPDDKFEHFANIAFFLKAHSIPDAHSILDKLTIVKKGIATYQLHPVGLLWLKRNTEIIHKKGMTKSFATVWTTNNKPNIPHETLQTQSRTITALWNTGVIENVYFDIEGTQEANAKTDFVFFVNANSKEEAESICNSLPFYTENIATYKIHQAGVFWMGKYEDQ